MRAGNEAGGAIHTVTPAAGDEDGHSRVTPEVVHGREGLLVVVGVVIAMPVLFTRTGMDAEHHGIAELRKGCAAFIFGTNLGAMSKGIATQKAMDCDGIPSSI